ncbi:assimilatory nitrate reductase catalytic subunit [Actinopolyspora lacussalsi]|nr:assimilatory nitrate reductase catalytic subunit [Actinopolyspora lacussalsi]
MSDDSHGRNATASGHGLGAESHCPYCALQCGTRLTPTTDGDLTVRPTDFPTNRGGLCRKGWTAPALLNTPDRLRSPLVRGRDGTLVETDWRSALDLIASRLSDIRDTHGPDAAAVFGGGGLTNEKSYMLGKFARVALGTSQIDYNGRFCMSAAAAAGNAAFGVDRGLQFPVTDLANSEVVLLAGGNPAETMPPLMRHLQHPDLIVVDPRRTRTAEQAALHLQPAPGTDLALALGLLHLAVAENLVDHDYIDRRTNGFEDMWAVVLDWWPERVERVTGVPRDALRRAVRMLATASRAHLLTGRGVEQHRNGTDTAAAFVNLALALGLPGRYGSGYGCLTGQGNGQGGREHGQKSDQLPGYRMITDPAARAHVAEVWGVPPESLPGPGRGAYELLDALGEPAGPRALLLHGSNPVVSAPNADHVAKRLRALDLLVVSDFVPSETAVLADVVLPATQWAEEEGTLTNLEGRVLRRRAALSAPPGARSDLEILHELAVRLGQPAWRFPTEPRAVFEELRRASSGGRADYSGISYERLDSGEALYWPCPSTADESHPGTPRPFLERFAHPDGRARFAAVDGTEHVPDPAYPLLLTTGRLASHYQSGAQTRRVAELTETAHEPYVEVHPDTADRFGLIRDEPAQITSTRGSAIARVSLVRSMRTDTIFLPFHFPGSGRANTVTSPVLDPISGMPEFKVCPARIAPCEERE